MKETDCFSIENNSFGDFASHRRDPWTQFPLINPPANVEAVEAPLIGATNYALYIKGDTNQGAQTNLQTQIKANSYYTVTFDLYSGGSVSVAAQLCTGPLPTCTEIGRAQATNTWQQVILPPNAPYRTGVITNDTYLRIINVSAGVQEFYIDNVNILPGLQKKTTQKPVELSTDPQLVQPSCRLYPQDSSPSCEYIEYDDGNVSSQNIRKSQKGWWGYCLEYDPRDSKICLQWWPVDKIKSETLTGDSQPILSSPLYQCLQEGLYEFRRAFPKTCSDHNCKANGSYHCPTGYYKTECWRHNRSLKSDNCVLFCIPNGILKSDVCPDFDANPQSENYHHFPGYWTQYDGSNSFNSGCGAIENFNGAPVEIVARRCDVIGQVVTPLGENRAWNNRVRVGAYNVWDIQYTKASDMDPYGSIVPPAPAGLDNNVNDPATWNSGYNAAWGPPISDDITAGLKKQPLYVLSETIPLIPDYFDEPGFLNLARAGSPYSCKHSAVVGNGSVYLCDNVGQHDATSYFYPRETFAGAFNLGNCIRGSEANECKGVGLKRIQRLFTNVYNVWIWSDGKCISPSAKMCTGGAGYEMTGYPCSVDANCNIANGRCSSKQCVGGANDGQPCGCPGGAVCSLGMKCDVASGPLNNNPCGLGACTQPGDACVTDRCSGGINNQQACNPANTCAAGETCTRTGAEDKCVDDSDPNCDCPGGGNCQAFTFCQNNHTQQCANDPACDWSCDMNDDGNGDGVIFCVSGNNDPCGVAPNPLHNCQPVSGRCSFSENRCSNNIPQTCSQPCTAPYTCSNNSKCVSAVGQCSCPGGGAFCAQGVCSNDNTKICSTANEWTQCFIGGVHGTCTTAANICTKTDARCDCGAGNCVESQRCSLAPFGNCDVSACVGGDCKDFFCVGGGVQEGLACAGPNDSAACLESTGTCIAGECNGTGDGARDGQGCLVNSDCWEQGQCVTAICVDGGINESGACAVDAACVGTQVLGTCTTFNGVCMNTTVNPNMSTGIPCRVGFADCAAGSICASQFCSGGIRDSQDCSVPAALPDRDKWCNLQEGNPNPLVPSYQPALPTNPIYSQITSDFTNMNQCRCPGGVCGLTDVRPGQANFPNDFCWVQPSVFNIKVNARSIGDITIPNGGGTVSLQFNTTADLEQLPIRWINVDWGDGTAPDTIKFTPGIFAKDNPNDPHIMLHDYNGPGGPYPIRVWIRDNWDKASGYCSGGANDYKQCAGDGDCPGGVCEGVCRGSGANDFKRCNAVNATIQCGGAPGYCSSIYNGRITVVP
jgi:hypothetical protein